MKKIKTIETLQKKVTNSNFANETYQHGIKTLELQTNYADLNNVSSTIQVVLGTAPRCEAITPILCKSMQEFQQKIGYVDIDNWDKYTLSRNAYLNFNVFNNTPIVYINVLDKNNSAHVVDATSKVTLDPNNNVTTTLELGAIESTIVCNDGTTDLVLNTDYTLSINNNSIVTIIFEKKASATVTITYKKLNPQAITSADIIGSNTPDKETGIACIRQVYPKLSLVPTLLIAPGYSSDKEVANALNNTCEKINGCYNAECIIDIECKNTTDYTKVEKARQALDIFSSHAILCWGKGKINEITFYLSEVATALMQYIDTSHDNIPYYGMSNQDSKLDALVLENNVEILLDETQANSLNAIGVCTIIRQGNNLVFWGNNTSAFPKKTDIKDRWIMVRRMFDWWQNNFCITYRTKVDNPINRRLVESIIDAEKIKINSYVARKIIAGAEIKYLDSENTTEDLLNGKINFHVKLAPFVPAEYIEAKFEYDIKSLQNVLGGDND